RESWTAAEPRVPPAVSSSPPLNGQSPKFSARAQ
ncbi:hypothetical protein A2U01_0108549, partial [Trifolium medium]|nr:hypothetical protein [Trifolium medium]